MQLVRENFPGYMSPSGMGFRPQRSVRLLAEDESISFDELISYKMSTRFELADRILDDLFKAIDKYGSATSKEAKAVLEKWDRQGEENSRGAYLFQKWRMKMFAHKDMFSTQWSQNNPRTTPDGLADPALAVKVLDEAVAEVKKEYGRIDVAWGEVYRLKSGSVDLPANGGDDFLGAFRVVFSGRDKQIIGGDSYVGIVEFGDKVKASVLVSYGNSSEKGSPHKGDQLKLFSEKKLRSAAFYKEDVAKVKVSTETLISR
jgi:acyl-homoserine-lactone acylase